MHLKQNDDDDDDADNDDDDDDDDDVSFSTNYTPSISLSQLSAFKNKTQPVTTLQHPISSRYGYHWGFNRTPGGIDKIVWKGWLNCRIPCHLFACH